MMATCTEMGCMVKGYKILQNNLMCVLGVNPKLSNLKREGVVDSRYAKFRCKNALVISINDRKTGRCYNKGHSMFDKNFVYKVGTLIIEEDYNMDSEVICGEGIHFFKTEEAALSWGNSLSEKRWYENGQLEKQRSYKEGALNGVCREWHSNGRLQLEIKYKNGEKNGIYRLYYDNGLKKQESLYKNGKIIDYYMVWYYDGSPKFLCEYKDNVRSGVYKSYYENGKLYAECVYKNGKVEGSHNTYKKDGQLYRVCEFINGKVIRESYPESFKANPEGFYKNMERYELLIDNKRMVKE